MNSDEYVKTFNIAGKEIKLGIDDYGQCYFVEWEEDGKIREMGLGTYNFHYMEDIYYLFDPIYKKLVKKDLNGEKMTPEEYSEWIKYKRIFEEEYISLED